MPDLMLTPGQLSFASIREVIDRHRPLALDSTCWKRVDAAATYVQSLIKENRVMYGINTGFGLLAHTLIPADRLCTLQHRILLSHAAGVGELLDDDIVRLILLFKINALARGYSGVRRKLIERLICFYNQAYYPCVPSKGSVGASGDLAPLAHLSLPLVGQGIVRYQGECLNGQQALQAMGLPTLELAPKEGLALINGTQVSTAIAIYYLHQAQCLLSASVVIGALSVDAACGTDTAFLPEIHEVRGQVGQLRVAKRLFAALQGSEIRESHRDCSKVQDPYCLRCQPQVLGACLDTMQHVQTILSREANAVTDNPLIFPEQDSVLSGGNFHAEPVGQAADSLAIAIAEVGAIAERRIALLIDPHFNGGLPPFLVNEAGLNSGFMLAQVTAAALASENKSLAHPASVDSIPTSANQEDHVSMATYAAYRLKSMVDNVRAILAIELLAACQGIELRKPKKTSPLLNQLLEQVRQTIPFWDEDRLFADDIQKAMPIVNDMGKMHLNALFDSN